MTYEGTLEQTLCLTAQSPHSLRGRCGVGRFDAVFLTEILAPSGLDCPRRRSLQADRHTTQFWTTVQMMVSNHDANVGQTYTAA